MKIGVVGHGMIVKMAFECIKYIDDVEVVAMYCHETSREKGSEMCKEYDVSAFYCDYDKFLADNSFDTVYCGLINSLHYEYTMKAMEAGKHVIVEKPFASTAREAQAMYNLAKK